MKHKSRGMALIFNQNVFNWQLNLGPRKGTDLDRDSLVSRYWMEDMPIKASNYFFLYLSNRTVINILILYVVRFKELDFEVKAYNDYSRDEVLLEIKEGTTSIYFISDMF